MQLLLVQWTVSTGSAEKNYRHDCHDGFCHFCPFFPTPACPGVGVCPEAQLTELISRIGRGRNVL